MSSFKTLVLVSVGLSIIQKCWGIIAYDCSQKVTNMTTFSLLNVGECDIKEPVVTESKVYARLLQSNEFVDLRVRYCKVQIKRSVKYCGMWDKTSEVSRGDIKFLQEVTREECRKMHDFKQYKVRDEIITNLKINDSIAHPMTFAGKIKANGECKNGASYSDPYGLFEDVIVQGYVEISLRETSATVVLNANEIILPSGTRCDFNKDQCIDVESGYAFWDPLPPSNCGEQKYAELYQGDVKKITEEGKRPVYIVEKDDISFAFSTIGKVAVCAFELLRTEHPKLFFIEGPDSVRFKTYSQPPIQSLNLFTYVNSKFVYVERHIRGEMKRLYHDLLLQKCELERRVIANALSTAVSAPDMFAYQITKEFGYMAVTSGEVVHVMKCVQVDVKRRETKTCYLELPVTKDNKNYFLAPRTHILKQYGTETACNPLIPPMFLLGENWFTVMPGAATKGTIPRILSPDTEVTWNYTDPAELANSGIYSPEEVAAMQRHMMFPVERPAMLNTIAMGMSGRPVHNNGLSLLKMLDEEELEKLAVNSWKRMWGNFLTFGSASAGVLGIFVIFRVIKLLIDSAIHGYALYSLYGWSVNLLGCLWNSVTQLLLHAGRHRESYIEIKKRRKEEERGEGNAGNAPPTSPLPETHVEPTRPRNHEQQFHVSQLYPYLINEKINTLPI